MTINKIKSFLILLMLGTTLPSIITSCGGDDDPFDLGKPNTGSDQNIAEYSQRLEVPAIRKQPGVYFVVHEAKVTDTSSDKVMNYCLEYDSASYHSRWVAFVFDSKTSPKKTSRADEPFTYDPELPAGCQLSGSAYSGLRGYNRGHLCASNDRLYSAEANVQTFYMSNMSPQMASFNQGYWITLENIVAGWGRSGRWDKLYVVKGGTIANGQLKSDSPWKTTNMQGKSVNVVIPKYYFMAILAEKNNTYQAIGFWMEHKEYGYQYSSPVPRSVMKTHAMSIDDLEDKTGIDFFHNLNDNVEAQVEATYNEASWTW